MYTRHLLGPAILTGLVAGIYPAFYIPSFPTALVLKGSFGLSQSGKKLRQVLISFQYVISLALIIGALFVHVQSSYMKKMPVGFDRENLLQTLIPGSARSRHNDFRERILQNPNILDVAFSNHELVHGGISRLQTEFGDEKITYDYRVVSADLLKNLGVTVTEGRDFTFLDALKPGAALLFNDTAQ